MTTPPERPDARGFRAKLGVLGPSTNTIVQPDMDDLRPHGVTNHYARIYVQNLDVSDNASFTALTDAITASVDRALDDVVTCAPNHIVMGMSAIAFYGGLKGAEAFRKRVEDRCGLGCSTGALSTAEALHRFGARRVAFVSPYFEVANREVAGFFADCGITTVRERCLKCPSPRHIAQVTEDELRAVLLDLDGDDVDALVQVGTNLSMLGLAAAAERMLGKPVIAINAATYWHALRTVGVQDRVHGFGSLLERF
jgi:maleate isomerase